MLKLYTLKEMNKKYFKKRNFRFKILYDRVFLKFQSIFIFGRIIIIQEMALKIMSSDIF